MSNDFYVRTPFYCHEYPCLATRFEGDGFLYGGTGHVWLNGNEKLEKEFIVCISNSTPLGTLSFYINPCRTGSWRAGHLDGAGIEPRDLQWVNAWASEAVWAWLKEFDPENFKKIATLGNS